MKKKGMFVVVLMLETTAVPLCCHNRDANSDIGYSKYSYCDSLFISPISALTFFIIRS